MIKCNCIKRNYSETANFTPFQKHLIRYIPCSVYDVEETEHYLDKVLTFTYRNESILDITEQLGKCISYVLFHLIPEYDAADDCNIFSYLSSYKTELRIPIHELPHFSKSQEAFRQHRLFSIFEEIDKGPIYTSLNELLEECGIDKPAFERLLKSTVSILLEDFDFDGPLSFSFIEKLRSSPEWYKYEELLKYYS
ncbi:hypothetical protein [Pseudoalteromonas lipolytica]|uniref:hypothetical protein n=1 Tax=Pseudoalteromonas lipolytica TaxID=570156 RepID=UPI00082404F6|nr:hypothetical protein [Pseudoalteromonas lipolytica]